MSGLVYRGGGFIPGVPARDLSPDEVKQHGESSLLASGLYMRPRKSKGGGSQDKAVRAPATQDKEESE